MAERFAASDRRIWGIYLDGFLYFFALAFSVLASVGIVNEILSGDASEPNSASIAASSTALVLNSSFKFLLTKYMCALSDYLGRKPVIIIGLLLQSWAFFMTYGATNIATIWIAACIRGSGDGFLGVALAWLVDVVENDELGTSFALLFGLSVGGGFTLGVPSGAILAQANSRLPLLISAIVVLLGAVWALFIPVNDVSFVRHTGTVSALDGHGDVEDSKTIPLITNEHGSAKNPLHQHLSINKNIDVTVTTSRDVSMSSRGATTATRFISVEGRESSGTIDVAIDGIPLQLACLEAAGCGAALEGRAVPSDLCSFLSNNHPLTFLSIIRAAKRKTNWYTQLWWQSGLNVLQFVFINYGRHSSFIRFVSCFFLSFCQPLPHLMCVTSDINPTLTLNPQPLTLNPNPNRNPNS